MSQLPEPEPYSYAGHIQADFQEAELSGSNLMNANVKDANFQKAFLVGANLKNTEGLTIEQLCSTYTLWRVELDQEIYNEVKVQCPDLLERPNTKK